MHIINLFAKMHIKDFILFKFFKRYEHFINTDINNIKRIYIPDGKI